MLPITGLVLALLAAAFAWRRSTLAPANYYERDVYGMTPRSHRRYALVMLVFAVAFALGYFVRALPAVIVMGVFAVVAILYAASFVRGASGEDE